jgi:hypothetical protein
MSPVIADGIQRVINGDGSAGKGCWRKRIYFEPYTWSPLAPKVAYLTATVEFVLGAPHLGGYRSKRQIPIEANDHG